jgi:ribosomal protein L7Ae-like RNA K-turn-binding protein
MFTRGKCHFDSGESSMIIIVLSIPQKESHDKILSVVKISNKSYKFKSGLKIKTL